MVNQWLRLHVPNAEALGLIPGQGTRSHIQQLNRLHAATKLKDPTCRNQDLAQPNKHISNIYIYKIFTVRQPWP